MGEIEMTAEELAARQTELANAVAAENDADVLLINSPIDRGLAFPDHLSFSNPRKHCLVILVTLGGDPDAGYRMARCLQRTYSEGKVSVLIPSMCKSAGTLIAIGANELVMGDNGELGPLDVQVRKRDELLERMSGLDVDEALASLQEKSFKTFEEALVNLNVNSAGGISLKTAMEVATQLTVGLFTPIYQQIDPMRVGEIAREIKIADKYGERLNSHAKNLKEGALARLIAEYPSHGFVIDKKEAEELFIHIRVPNPKELQLLAFLRGLVRRPLDQSFIQFISTDRVTLEQQNESNRGNSATGTEATSGIAPNEASSIPTLHIARAAGD